MKKILMLFSVLSLTLTVFAQEPNDCIDAITVCGNGVFRSNATGSGNEFEINSCSGFEHHSIWLKVDIVQGGTLGFDLIPDDPDIMVDYDFWVFAPNSSCSNLGAPIRCSTTNPDLAGLPNNHTGINGSTTTTQSGPGANGNGYVYWLNVNPGESYYIAVDRPVGDGGFEIQWTGTATTGSGAFPTPPTANDMEDVITCSTTPGVGIFNLNSLKSSITSTPGASVEFYENLADATDGINQLADPIANPLGIYATTSSPTQIYAKVVSPGTACYSLTDFNLVVEAVPDASVTRSPASICQSEEITYSFTGSPNTTVHYEIDGGATESIVLDNSGNATLVTTAWTNTTLQLIDVQIIMASGTVACSTSLTQSVSTTVSPGTVPTFTPVDPICENDTLGNLPTTSLEGITGAWSPAIDNTVTTTYTFTPDAGQCAVPQSMEIIVTPGATPTFDAVDPICYGDTLAPLPTSSTEGITGSWLPALDNTATTTYTFTPDPGQCSATQTLQIVVNPLSNPTFADVDPICSGDTLSPLPTTSLEGITGTWAPAIDNTVTTTYTFTPDAGQCANSQTLDIVVNQPTTPTFAAIASICSGDVLAPLPTTSVEGVTGSWSPALDNTQTTTYTFTPDAGSCALSQTLDIVVNQPTVPTFAAVAPICNGDALAPLPTTSIEGVTGTWSPALNNTTTTTYTFTPDAGACATTQTLEIIVNPLPIITMDSMIGCSVSADGFSSFDLNAEIPQILGSTQSTTDFTVTFYEDAGATNSISTNPYTNTTAYNQTIYVMITPSNASCPGVFPFELQVLDGAQATMPMPEMVCDYDGENDGLFAFDLTILDQEVLNGQDENIYKVSYYETAVDAENGTNPILNPQGFVNSTPYNQTIYIRVENSNIPDVCYATTTFDYEVSPILKPVISSSSGSNTLCVDYSTGQLQNSITLMSDLQGSNYAYTWYLDGVEISGANQEQYVVDTAAPGLYTLTVTEIQLVANCTSEISESFEIIQSGAAQLVSVTQTGTFEANPSINVLVEGYGEYWFQLDDGPILDNGGVFTNVSGGTHSVTVYDRKTENPSCDPPLVIDDIRIISYPKYFTPNNDGINDTWNITAMSNQPGSYIEIYDRYGKFLEKILPSSTGWNGTYRGENLPTNDYWFILNYEESGVPKQFKSHFTLKR
ncbi:T9SS type B sorting domain-containing protein [Tamlana sp. s12]|uniref:T9SS type B sorting domain-containing protein n=1 Tax=Tamlana sp. s12 TaxID=1630406 RepID=UPI00192C7EF6|nr:T9SS type B sorting domain-containing protein [Tamlana sp. s12]QQY81302.1 T9SS type B sorting domain-containing protein [Tamlana sp. s12]